MRCSYGGTPPGGTDPQTDQQRLLADRVLGRCPEGALDIFSYLANVRNGTDAAAGPDAGEYRQLKRKILATVLVLLLVIIAIVVIAVVAI